MTSKHIKSISTNDAWVRIESLIKEYCKADEDDREKVFREELNALHSWNSSKIIALIKQRCMDLTVETKSKLSCFDLTYSEKRRSYVYQLRVSEEIYSDEVFDRVFRNPVRLLLGMLAKYNIFHKAEFLIEAVYLPVPTLLVECLLIVPGYSGPVGGLRVDISRLHHKIWMYQDVFYGAANFGLKKKSKADHWLKVGDSKKLLKRIGPGVPLCWNDIRLDLGYTGNVSNVELKLCIYSNSSPTYVNVENFGDELYKRIYEDYMTKPYPFMINPSRGFTG